MVQGGGCCSHSIRKPTPPTQRQTEQALWWGSQIQRDNVPLLAFFCRYGQVGENASAVLLSVRSATGLTVKEKLGGEREGVWYREGEREWEVPDSEREGEGRVIYVLRCYSLIQSQGRTRSVRAEQSSRGIECKCAAGLKSKQKAGEKVGMTK